MNTKLALTAALLATSVAGCAVDADPDLEGAEELELEQVESEVTSCSPVISAAAITRQVSRIEDPIVDVQLVTISPQPFRYTAYWVQGPTGMSIFGIGSSCTLRTDGRYRCAHNFSVSPGQACYASGNYRMYFYSSADAGSGCSGSSYTSIPFSLTTEYMCSHDFDGY